MANKITYGLAAISMGPLNAGAMSTSLVELGYVEENSCTFIQADGTKKEFRAEQVDDAVKTVSKRGESVLSLVLMAPDADTAVLMLGGTKVTGPPVKYQAPRTGVSVTMSVLVVPIEGGSLSITKANVEAKWDGSFSKENLLRIVVKATVQVPDTGPPFEITYA